MYCKDCFMKHSVFDEAVKMSLTKIATTTLTAIFFVLLASYARAEQPQWELRPKQSTVLFSRDADGKSQRASSTAILLSESGDQLFATDAKSVFAYSLTQKVELWRFAVEDPRDLTWLNQGKWIVISTPTNYLVVDTASGETLYRSKNFDRLLVRTIGNSKSLVAVEGYGTGSGELRLHAITFGDDGSYFDAYEEVFLAETIWLRDLAIDEIRGQAYLLASSIENGLIQNAWLKAFDLSFEESGLVVGISEKEINIELDAGANRLISSNGRLAIGGDIHSKKLWFYDSISHRKEVAEFSSGTFNLLFSSQENLLFANGGEQTYNRNSLIDLIIIDLDSAAILRRIKAPAFGPVRMSRTVTSFSVAQNKIGLAIVDYAEMTSGSETEPIVPAIVVLEFPTK